MIVLMTASAQQAPWWQTALASLIPALGGALVALLGVWLNGRQTDKREARKAKEDDNAQRLTQERAVIADLIADTLPWVTAVRAQYLAAWLVMHPSQQGQLKEELWDKSIEDIERFAAVLWKARVTVHNPLARSSLDDLMAIYRDFTYWLESYEETHDHNEHAAEDVKLNQLRPQVEEICSGLETAALDWDGTQALPSPRTVDSEDLVDAP